VNTSVVIDRTALTERATAPACSVRAALCERSRAHPARSRVWSEDVGAGDGVLRLGLRKLGVYCVVFVVSAPLIAAAAVALRYVHILSHVAESSG